jgi:hypothetical protein
MMAKLHAHHERMGAGVNAWWKEMTACWEVTEAYPEMMETDPEEMKCVALHEEIPKEDASVKTVRALTERYGDWHVAVRRRRWLLKKGSQGDGGS